MTGLVQTLIEEKSASWINLHDMLVNVSSSETSFQFLWASERTGYRQLYLYEYNIAQRQIRQLSENQPVGGGGEWVIDSICDVDASNKVVYVQGNYSECTEKHLIRLSWEHNRAGMCLLLLLAVD